MKTDRHNPAAIDPLPEKSCRFFWSVMIPTYRPQETYLRQTLESVLSQAPGPEQMQIEVVDDASPDVDVAALVRSIAGGRVAFSRTTKNLGLAGCWNTCIGRARGQWVHILHQDDYVLPEFYQTLARAAARHPEVGLLATRSFFVDAEAVVISVSPRLKNLEGGTRAADDLFYSAPFQCPGVVVKRSVYEARGGFRTDLAYTLDLEMWARAISATGGLLTPEVLACYRQSDSNETGRLLRTAENLRDIDRLNKIFSDRHPGFDGRLARGHQLARSLQMAALFESKKNPAAAAAAWDYWKKNATPAERLRRLIGSVIRKH